MKFLYVVGALEKGRSFLDEISSFAQDHDIPVIVNGGMWLSQKYRKRFTRIRDHFRNDYHPENSGTLDHFILQQDTRKSRDYRQFLSEYFERLLRFYRGLSNRFILVPGPFDVMVEDIYYFQNQFELNIPEDLLDENRITCQFCDVERVQIFGSQKQLLGIGGTTSFSSSLPGMIQHGRYNRLKQTRPEQVRQVFSGGADYLVTGMGVEGTFDRDLNDKQQLDGGLSISDGVNVHRMILDGCVSSKDVHSLVDRTDNIPVLHGKIQGTSSTFTVVSEEQGEYDLEVEVYQDHEIVRRYRNHDGNWITPRKKEEEAEEQLVTKTSIQAYSRGIRKGTEMAKVYNNRGIARRIKGDLDGAISDYRKAIECRQNYAPAYNNLGVVMRRKGKPGKAVKNYSLAIEKDPEYEKPYANRASIYLERGSYRKAVKDYTRAISLNSSDEEMFVNRGIAFRKLNELDKALQDFEQAHQRNAENPRIHFQKGLTRIKQEDFEAALECFSRAVRLDSEYGEAHFYRGRMYRMTQQPKWALYSFSQAIKYLDSPAKAYTERANILDEQDRYEEAIEDWNKYFHLKEEKTNLTGLVRRGILHFREGNDHQAKSDLQVFLEQAETDHPGYEKASNVLSQLSNQVPSGKVEKGSV